jgi:nucleoid DNA-binding protein
MKKSELVDAVAEATGTQKKEAQDAVEAVLDTIDRKSTRLNSSH